MEAARFSASGVVFQTDYEEKRISTTMATNKSFHFSLYGGANMG